MSNDKTPDDVAELGLRMALEHVNEIFDEHLKKHPDEFQESDRGMWSLGFLSGFSSGFTTAAVRAQRALDARPKTRLPDQGAN